MFRKFGKLASYFGTVKEKYSKYLSPHILNIVGTKSEFSHFVKDIDELADSPLLQNQEKMRAKLNVLFNAYSLPVIFDRHRGELIQMIKKDEIRNQAELDKITKWLQKTMKFDRNIEIQDLKKRIGEEQSSELTMLENELMELREKKEAIQMSELSKKMREKYFSLDSQVIFKKCKEIVGENKSKKGSSNQFWDKLHSIRPRILDEECNDPQITRQHQEITGGRLRFRFPPQPNGYLHIGHIKSIRINFQTAKRMGGSCYLRYDDTNPETESHEYIDNILSNVRWLGYEPDKITFASDYFEEMIGFAVQLIKEGHAYVCDSSQSQIEEERREKRANKFRERSIEQSLKMFPNLAEGQTLRLKLDPQAKNPTLRDPIIYRIKNLAHPRTGNKYRVYPIYDFAHCIGDSLEHIDYSLCSLQFQVRRELYYKILHLLNLFKPTVWEYSRLNVEGSVISKRKIKALLDQGVIHGWDDPRLLTIGGLKNRGYSPEVLLRFIDKVNASRTGNENVVQYSLLERELRKQLMEKSEKSMMVLDPKQVVINNYEQLASEEKQNVSKIIYIDQQLEKGQIIILKYIGAFKVISNDDKMELERMVESVQQLKEKQEKFKVIHWISDKNAERIKVITFEKLLNQKGEPTDNSKKQHTEALVDKKILSERGQNKYYQMERLGFFKFNTKGEFIRCIGL